MHAPDPEPVRLGVVGSPDVVANSLSPRMMAAALDALGVEGSYVPLPIEPGEDVDVALRALLRTGLRGCNVTMPYKMHAARVADRRTPRAEAAGAANTLRVEPDGSVSADATDGVALIEAAAAHGIELAGARVLVVGAGGAATEAALACAEAGARAMTIVNRTPTRAAALAERLRIVAPALPLQVLDHLPIGEAVHAVIGCVPADAHASQEYVELDGDPSFLDYAYLRSGGPTPMMVAAEHRDARHVDGRELLVRQGRAALRFWFDAEAPIEVMSRAVR